MLLIVLSLVFLSVSLAAYAAIDAAFAYAAAQVRITKRGGLTFVRAGRVSVSYCVSRR